MAFGLFIFSLAIDPKQVQNSPHLHECMDQISKKRFQKIEVDLCL